jgi:hypothetical protein
MAGKEPEEYRPRRAFTEPTSEPVRTGPPAPDDEDRKPLYRDEVPAPPTADQSGLPTESDTAASDEEQARLKTRTIPRVAAEHRAGDESTQILPRTRRAGAIPKASGAAGGRSDFDTTDDDRDLAEVEGPRMGQRTKMALLIGAVAGVVIIGLAIGYAVLALADKPSTGPSPGTSTSLSSPGSSGSPTPDPNALLNDRSMLTVAEAKLVAPTRAWKVALTQRGLDQNSPQPACLGVEAVDGQPASLQSILRLLSSSGAKSPSILHQADAYASPQEAAQAYAFASKALGGCTMTGAYIDSGWVVSGLGDQAVGLVVRVSTGSVTEFRSVLLNRTGRIVNVVDVAQPDQAASVTDLAKALAAVTRTQCATAGGRCAAATAVKAGPPPVGGDQPGFLAYGDLPPVGDPVGSWVANDPDLPNADFTGSGCETVNWSKTPALKRTARTYFPQDNGGTFGLDEIVLTLRTPKAASDLANSVKSDLDSCEKRKLTAKVPKPAKVRGAGAGGTAISGWTAEVSQKTTDGTARYRVGVVSAGPKVVFTFLNPQQSFDLTDARWGGVTVRAGERATQVR